MGPWELQLVPDLAALAQVKGSLLASLSLPETVLPLVVAL